MVADSALEALAAQLYPATSPTLPGGGVPEITTFPPPAGQPTPLSVVALPPVPATGSTDDYLRAILQVHQLLQATMQQLLTLLANQPTMITQARRSSRFITGRITLGSSAVAKLLPANPLRQSVNILNNGSNSVYIEAVTFNQNVNGHLLLAGSNITLTDYTGEVWAISSSGSNTVSILEQSYDS